MILLIYDAQECDVWQCDRSEWKARHHSLQPCFKLVLAILGCSCCVLALHVSARVLNLCVKFCLRCVHADGTFNSCIAQKPAVRGGQFIFVCALCMQVVLSIAALHKGLLSVVANSLVGSILSNLLLVMGKPRCSVNKSWFSHDYVSIHHQLPACPV